MNVYERERYHELRRVGVPRDLALVMAQVEFPIDGGHVQQEEEQ